MTLYLTGPNPNQLAQYTNDCFNKLYKWCLWNRLTINTNQTYYILFTTKRIINLPNIHINNELITKTNKNEFLGVLYDDYLLFKHHISKLTLKISRHIALLNQIKDYMPLDVLKSVYYDHIHSLLPYCSPIWCTT